MNEYILFSWTWLHSAIRSTLFPLFSLWTRSSQPISFFFPLFFFTLLIYAQPTLDLNLAWRTYFSWFFDLFFGVRHDLAHFKNDHTKSKVLGHMTAQHLILISTSEWGCTNVHRYKQTQRIQSNLGPAGCAPSVWPAGKREFSDANFEIRPTCWLNACLQPPDEDWSMQPKGSYIFLSYWWP